MWIVNFRKEDKQDVPAKDSSSQRRVPPSCPYRFPPDQRMTHGLPSNKDAGNLDFPSRAMTVELMSIKSRGCICILKCAPMANVQISPAAIAGSQPGHGRRCVRT